MRRNLGTRFAKQLGGTDLHYVNLLVYYYLKSKTFSALNFLHSGKGLPVNTQLSAELAATNSPQTVLFGNFFKIYFSSDD